MAQGGNPWRSRAEAILGWLMLLKLQAWNEQDCELFEVYYRAERDLRQLLEERPPEKGMEE